MKKILGSLLLLVALMLAACGGGGSSTVNIGATKTGVFIDAPVDGLNYKALPSGKTGVTKDGGKFEYEDGDKVTFLMGTLELGSGKPDAAKEIKITQLANATLIGQLLQTINLSADANKIDVTGIVIPEAVIQAILNKIESGSKADVVSQAELDEIKAENVGTIEIPATVIVSKDDVIAHIKDQVADDSLQFTESELNNHFFVSANSLTYKRDSMIARFDEGKKLRWIDGDQSALSYYSKHDWAVVGGKIEVQFSKEDGSPNICTVTKFAENDTSVDANISCADGHADLLHFLKPRSFSISDLSGKVFTVKGGKNETNNNADFTMTFGNDGSLVSSDESNVSGIFKDSKYINAVWVNFDVNSPNNGILALLVEGTIDNGTLVAVEYDDDNNFDGVSVLKTSANNVWTFVHESGDGGSTSNPVQNKIDITRSMLVNKVFWESLGEGQGESGYAKMTISADGTSASRHEIWTRQDGSVTDDTLNIPLTISNGEINVLTTNDQGNSVSMLFTLLGKNADSWELNVLRAVGLAPSVNTSTTWFLAKPAHFPANL